MVRKRSPSNSIIINWTIRECHSILCIRKSSVTKLSMITTTHVFWIFNTIQDFSFNRKYSIVSYVHTLFIPRIHIQPNQLASRSITELPLRLNILQFSYLFFSSRTSRQSTLSPIALPNIKSSEIGSASYHFVICILRSHVYRRIILSTLIPLVRSLFSSVAVSAFLLPHILLNAYIVEMQRAEFALIVYCW